MLIPKKMLDKMLKGEDKKKKKDNKKPPRKSPFYAIRQMFPSKRIYRRKSF